VHFLVQNKGYFVICFKMKHIGKHLQHKKRSITRKSITFAIKYGKTKNTNKYVNN